MAIMAINSYNKMMIDALISQITSQLNVDTGTAQNATGGLLSLIKENVDGGTFGELLGAIPGADALVNNTPSAAPEAAGSGFLGNIGGMLSDAIGGELGGTIGSIAGMAGLAKSTGLDLGDLGNLTQIVTSFIGQQGGDGLLQKIPSNVPGLDDILTKAPA